MLSLSPKDLTPQQVQAYLQGAIGPRPIALASTVDAAGVPNLSPFSFFNVFSSNPPILVFSPARRVRNNTVKHTLENVQATKEVVISVVNYDMVQQVSLASTEYGDGVNEFIKAGLTMKDASEVTPYLIGESPVQFECKVNDIIALGDGGGAGNLVICEVIKIHVNPEVLDQTGAVDQHKIDLVARMGGNWYSRANRGLFEIEKPLTTLGLGADAIPAHILEAAVLSGNEIGQLGNVEKLPNHEEITIFVEQNTAVKQAVEGQHTEVLFEYIHQFLSNNQVADAWKLILSIRS